MTTEQFKKAITLDAAIKDLVDFIGTVSRSECACISDSRYPISVPNSQYQNYTSNMASFRNQYITMLNGELSELQRQFSEL